MQDQLFYLYDGVFDPAFFRRGIQLYHHGADLQYDQPCGIQAAVYRTGTETADQGDRSETGRAQDVAYPGTVQADQPELGIYYFSVGTENRPDRIFKKLYRNI